jgi:hypothetical protein
MFALRHLGLRGCRPGAPLGLFFGLPRPLPRPLLLPRRRTRTRGCGPFSPRRPFSYPRLYRRPFPRALRRRRRSFRLRLRRVHYALTSDGDKVAEAKHPVL